ncbi:hypothetical protein V8D89_005084 [Ganoderma adspersum]
MLESGSVRACGLSPFYFTGTSTGLGCAGTEPALENGKIVVTTARKPERKGDTGELEVMEESQARTVLKTIFWGAVSITREAVKCRETNHLGMGIIGYSSYCASNFALEGVSETLTAELDPVWNIKVEEAPSPCWFAKLSISSPTQGDLGATDQDPDLPTYMRHVGWDNVVTWKDTRRSAEAFYKIVQGRH